MNSPFTLDRARFDAVIFDLDGVITSTQRLHAEAWKTAFDEALERETATRGKVFEPFAIDPEYYRHVDGKPRYDGVRSFLTARGLVLPEGDPDDPAGEPTVHGIGNRKNGLFRELLATRGAEVYPAAMHLISSLREAGFALAVVSSSRNCRMILDSVGATVLFHAHIDGNDSARLGLSGKPAPDLFLEAAHTLSVPPERTVILEDAIAGVAAGRAGGFGLVIGVDRRGEQRALAEAGADLVVNNLGDVEVGGAAMLPPNAIDALAALRAEIGGRPLAVFLDYDGTLTPIVDRPELAVLDGATRRILEVLALRRTTAIISGRDLDDVCRLVDVDGVVYAGSHGLDIRLADGTRRCADGAETFLPQLDRAEAILQERLEGIEGALLERKRFAIAAHYRLVDQAEVPAVEAAVDEALRSAGRLRKRGGKCIFELLPAMDWHKGSAVRWLIEQLGNENTVAVYVGDDLTDEDAFHAVRVGGIGVAVMDEPYPTAARFSLKDTDAVRRFLEILAGSDA